MNFPCDLRSNLRVLCVATPGLAVAAAAALGRWAKNAVLNIMTSETITIARAELTADVSRELINSLNAELRGYTLSIESR